MTDNPNGVAPSSTTSAMNWYGSSTIQTFVPGRKTRLKLTQQTDYPRDGRVVLKLTPGSASPFALKLRIPHWSRETTVKVNGKPVEGVTPGTYLALDRTWKRGDTVEIDFDFSLHFWRGERECAGKTSIYRGPLLLTYDRRFNEMDPEQIPALDAMALAGKVVPSHDWIPPMLLMEFTATDGRMLRLCDFGSAGVGGSPYRSWFEVKNVGDTPFSRTSPLRSGRVG